ncbi:unnamed protein product [Haemonchus placei]|uniref:Uncharacterized protein n=1 Tax=Haemonchus placei TaxID=6290 RepID=A0A0N4VZ49_HAEPC|nr:unnamed protein product [Haemonchus placei]
MSIPNLVLQVPYRDVETLKGRLRYRCFLSHDLNLRFCGLVKEKHSD